MSIPQLDSCFCFHLRTGALKLGKCEIVIGVFNIILAIALYNINSGTLVMLPKKVWLVYALLNRKHLSTIINAKMLELLLKLIVCDDDFIFAFHSHSNSVLWVLAVRCSYCKSLHRFLTPFYEIILIDSSLRIKIIFIYL